MLNIKLKYIAVIIIISLFVLASPVFSLAGKMYNVSANYSLTEDKNGIDGQLLLMKDKNLKYDRPNEHLESDIELRNAELIINDNKNNTISSLILDSPFADLKRENLGDIKIFFLTIDYSIGFGSYVGPRTKIFLINNAKIQWQDAKDVNSGEKQKIKLQNTLKTAWKIDLHSNNIKIYQIKCRPDHKGSFLVIYETYTFNGKEWLRYKKETKSFWENEGVFPELSRFPQPK